MPGRVLLLGPPALEQGQQVRSLGHGKGVALVAFLATEGLVVGRQRLTYLFWPDHLESEARTNLRQLIKGLKGKPLGECLELDGPSMRFVGTSDTQEFELAKASQDWDAALGLWRGEFLEGLEAESDTLDEWLQLQRERWNRAWREAVLGRVAQLEQSGRVELALEHLENLIGSEWLSEELYARAIRLAHKQGSRTRALELFARLKQRLWDELGLQPLPQTVALLKSVHERPEAGPVVESTGSGEIPMVGREQVQSQLTELVGSPGLILVSGEGGVGKTRLLAETLSDALILRAEEGLTQSPFHPLVRALAAAQDQILVLPEATRQELKRLIPQLPGPTPNPDPNPEIARAQLVTALLEGLGQIAGNRVLVLEDLHWADEATLGFVAEWTTRWAGSGGTLLVSVRPEEALARPALENALQSLRNLRILQGEIRLERLDPQPTQSLVGAFLGQPDGPPIFAERIFRASGGNPLFTLEVLRQLVAEGTLQQDELGEWYTPYDQTTQDYTELGLPESVRVSLQRRLSFLSEAERRVADTAAVSGVGFETSLAERVTGLDGWGLASSIESLVQRGLLMEDGSTYRMSHDLLRQHTYSAIPQARRRLLHRSFAEVLEPADWLAAANHWKAAGELARAVNAWMAAGSGFYQQGLFDDAQAMYRLAAEQAPSYQESLWAKVHLATLYRSNSRIEQATGLLSEVLEHSSEPRIRILALVVRAELYFNTGEPRQAIALAEEAVRLFQVHPDQDLYQQVLGIEIKVADVLGHNQRAIELLRAELERSKAQPFHPNRTSFQIQLAHHLDALERYQEALPIYRLIIKQVRQQGDQLNLVYAAGQHLFCCTRLGHAEEGLETALHALTLGELESSAGLRYHLVRAYVALKRYAEAVDAGQTLLEKYNSPYIRCAGFAVLAEAYAGLGLKEKSLEAIEEALHHSSFGVSASFTVRAITSTLRVGSAKQRKQAMDLLENLSLETVPAYHRTDLEEALKHN